MKRARLRQRHRELICSFVKYGMLMLLCGGILFYQITLFNKNPFSNSGYTWAFWITSVEFLAFIALVGFFLYRKSVSYLLWYEGVLNSLAIPIIVTDKDGALCFVNKTAQQLIFVNQDAELNDLNSKHLIDANRNVKKTRWFHKGEEYKTDGNCFLVDGKNAGYIITLFNTRQMGELLDTGETRDELISKINTLLKRLGTATEHFKDCANTIAGNSAQQADIINGLSEVITGIASGTIEAPDDLNEKMRAVKAKMLHHVEIGGTQTKLMIQTAQELQSARDSVGNVLRNIGQTSKM